MVSGRAVRQWTPRLQARRPTSLGIEADTPGRESRSHAFFPTRLVNLKVPRCGFLGICQMAYFASGGYVANGNGCHLGNGDQIWPISSPLSLQVAIGRRAFG
jgi:hypothetical protein